MPSTIDVLSDQVIQTALERAAWERRHASIAYETAIEQAYRQGWSATRIASACDLTEGAIRMHLRRRGFLGPRSKKVVTG
jgi:DNA-directed RNA polymerase specialized sigma24 family protein